MTEAKMQESVQYKPGTFCWIELGTSDGPAAKKFYTQLFNWDSEDNDTGPGGIYTILKQNGKAVGGLYQLTPDMTSAGVPISQLRRISPICALCRAGSSTRSASSTLSSRLS